MPISRDLQSLDQLEALSKKVLGFSKSEWAEVQLTSSHNANLRYAANTVTTSGTTGNTSLTVTAVNGKKAGSASTNDLSEDGLRRAVRRAEEIASLAPENEELMPPVTGKQSYPRTSQYDEPTTDVSYTANERAKIAGFAIQEARARNFLASGFLQTTVEHVAYRNSKGLFATDQSTRNTFSTTMRSADGYSSGWNKRATHAIARLDGRNAVARAADKCAAWSTPKEMDPGSYPTILEPSAAADMIQQFVWSLDAREADEGRSAFSRPGGTTALGEQLFNPQVHIYSNPSHPLAPARTFSEAGLPTSEIDWVKDGKLANLSRSRYWAQKTGKPVVLGASNIIMDGGTQLPDDFLFNVKEGLLITSFWYIRDVDDQTLLKTGLTRDGVFWVENGKIVNAVLNFRWNESPLNVLKNIVGMSKSVVTAPRDGWDGIPMMVPMLHLSGFNYSSISDAI